MVQGVCGDLWNMEYRFSIVATYDVLPSPQNLKLWINGDPLCSLHSGTATLSHILSAVKLLCHLAGGDTIKF